MQIGESYAILSDPQRRARFDAGIDEVRSGFERLLVFPVLRSADFGTLTLEPWRMCVQNDPHGGMSDYDGFGGSPFGGGFPMEDLFGGGMGGGMGGGFGGGFGGGGFGGHSHGGFGGQSRGYSQYGF